MASGHRSLVMRSVIPGAVVGPIPEFLEHFVEKCRAWWASLDDSKCRHHGIFEIGNTVVTQQYTPVLQVLVYSWSTRRSSSGNTSLSSLSVSLTHL